jgi:hypothetical protein
VNLLIDADPVGEIKGESAAGLTLVVRTGALAA